MQLKQVRPRLIMISLLNSYAVSHFQYKTYKQNLKLHVQIQSKA